MSLDKRLDQVCLLNTNHLNEMMKNCFKECILNFDDSKLSHEELKCLRNCQFREQTSHIVFMNAYGNYDERMDKIYEKYEKEF